MSRYQMIKYACKEQGKNISQLERDLGFSKGYISKINSHNPSGDKMQKIADYLNIPVGDLISGKGSVPVYEVAAGEGRINDGVPGGTIETDEAGDSTYIKVCGDSMYPSLHDGDVLKVDPSINGAQKIDFALVKVNGDEVTVKHVEIVDGGVWLRAENKDVFEDRFYTMQEVMTLPVTIIGKATSIVMRAL